MYNVFVCYYFCFINLNIMHGLWFSEIDKMELAKNWNGKISASKQNSIPWSQIIYFSYYIFRSFICLFLICDPLLQNQS